MRLITQSWENNVVACLAVLVLKEVGTEKSNKGVAVLGSGDRRQSRLAHRLPGSCASGPMEPFNSQSSPAQTCPTPTFHMLLGTRREQRAQTFLRTSL